jgi:hypothetical protein
MSGTGQINRVEAISALINALRYSCLFFSHAEYRFIRIHYSPERMAKLRAEG